MKSANPYLNFKGNTEEAFNFYKAVFGGEVLGLQKTEWAEKYGSFVDKFGVQWMLNYRVL